MRVLVRDIPVEITPPEGLLLNENERLYPSGEKDYFYCRVEDMFQSTKFEGLSKQYADAIETIEEQKKQSFQAKLRNKFLPLSDLAVATRSILSVSSLRFLGGGGLMVGGLFVGATQAALGLQKISEGVDLFKSSDFVDDVQGKKRGVYQILSGTGQLVAGSAFVVAAVACRVAAVADSTLLVASIAYAGFLLFNTINFISSISMLIRLRHFHENLSQKIKEDTPEAVGDALELIQDMSIYRDLGPDPKDPRKKIRELRADVLRAEGLIASDSVLMKIETDIVSLCSDEKKIDWDEAGNLTRDETPAGNLIKMVLEDNLEQQKNLKKMIGVSFCGIILNAVAMCFPVFSLPFGVAYSLGSIAAFSLVNNRSSRSPPEILTQGISKFSQLELGKEYTLKEGVYSRLAQSDREGFKYEYVEGVKTLKSVEDQKKDVKDQVAKEVNRNAGYTITNGDKELFKFQGYCYGSVSSDLMDQKTNELIKSVENSLGTLSDELWLMIFSQMQQGGVAAFYSDWSSKDLNLIHKRNKLSITGVGVATFSCDLMGNEIHIIAKQEYHLKSIADKKERASIDTETHYFIPKNGSAPYSYLKFKVTELDQSFFDSQYSF